MSCHLPLSNLKSRNNNSTDCMRSCECAVYMLSKTKGMANAFEWFLFVSGSAWSMMAGHG